MKKINFIKISLLFLSITMLIFVNGLYLIANGSTVSKEKMIRYSIEMIKSIPYSVLITTDSAGTPAARIMEPFSPNENMIIRFGTNVNSRKIAHIKKNSNVMIIYTYSEGKGYAVIYGRAIIENDIKKKHLYWKKSWARFYKKDLSNYVLIKVIPQKVEILDPEHGITGDPVTWRVPTIFFK